MSTESDSVTETQEGKNKRIAGELTIPFPDDFVYSNASAMGTSLMDIHVSFAEVLPTGLVRAKVGVVIPAEHAAQLVINLLAQINLYESTFGELRHPEWREFSKQGKANAEAIGQRRKPHPPAPEPLPAE
jgi:hypothetical protein